MNRRPERLLRWYPSAWRARYGEEFLALLEDQLDGEGLGRWPRARIAAAGLRERFHESGIVGEAASSDARRRGGSLLVLAAWAGMVVGGVGLAKSAEHFSGAMAFSTRADAQVAYDVAVGAGLVGSLLVVVAALTCLPAFVRFIASGGWTHVRGAVTRALAASALLGVATLGLVWWAHHLSASQRNGGDAAYGVAFLLVAALGVVALSLWTAAAMNTVTTMEIDSLVWRVEGLLAVGVAGAAACLTASALAWWLDVGRHAPWFFQGTAPKTSHFPWSTPMTLNVAIMLVSLVVAGWGVSRIASARLALASHP